MSTVMRYSYTVTITADASTEAEAAGKIQQQLASHQLDCTNLKAEGQVLNSDLCVDADWATPLPSGFQFHSVVSEHWHDGKRVPKYDCTIYLAIPDGVVLPKIQLKTTSSSLNSGETMYEWRDLEKLPPGTLARFPELHPVAPEFKPTWKPLAKFLTNLN